MTNPLHPRPTLRCARFIPMTLTPLHPPPPPHPTTPPTCRLCSAHHPPPPPPYMPPMPRPIDCIECMACSDNVVRAGLTPKFKDVERLCSIIDLRPPTTENTIFFAPSPSIDPNDPYLITFRPEQATEFAVDQIKVCFYIL